MGALQPEDKYNCFQGEETVFLVLLAVGNNLPG